MLETDGCEFTDGQDLKVNNFDLSQSTYKFEDTQGNLFDVNGLFDEI